MDDSRETSNIWYTRYKTKDKQKNNAICDGHHCTETNTNRVNMTWTLLQTNTNRVNMTWTLLQTNTNRINMTWTLLQTIGDKDEPNIVLMWTSQHGTNLLECKDT
jgi:hypothetical protein